MKSVYQASNTLEAHMLRHLLSQEDIDSEIEGGETREAFGDLQGIGDIHIMVKDHQLAYAQKIISEWQQSEPEIPDTEPRLPRHGKWLSLFIIGLICTMFVFAIY